MTNLSLDSISGIVCNCPERYQDQTVIWKPQGSAHAISYIATATATITGQNVTEGTELDMVGHTVYWLVKCQIAVYKKKNPCLWFSIS